MGVCALLKAKGINMAYLICWIKYIKLMKIVTCFIWNSYRVQSNLV